MAKDDKNPFESMMKGFGLNKPREGFGMPGMMIGRDSAGNPGIQISGNFIPFSEANVNKSKGKNDKDDKDDKAEKAKLRLRTTGPRIMDVDFDMKGKMSRTPAIAPVKKTEDSEGKFPWSPKGKTMKNGGLVRGCGAAQRGKGRGKMV
jgi:hypothetical protein